MGDQRDERSWVAIELSRAGEILAAEGTLDQHLRRDLRVDDDYPIFVPVALFRRKGRVQPIPLMEGYAFLQAGLDEVAYYALEQQPYINQVMSTRQGKHRFRYLSVISHAQVEAMRLKLRQMVSAEIPLQSTVTITDGRYRGLEGKVIGLDENNGFVRITLRSLDVVATIPRIFLEEVPGE
jgi:transcription antitermination factor NusG